MQCPSNGQGDGTCPSRADWHCFEACLNDFKPLAFASSVKPVREEGSCYLDRPHRIARERLDHSCTEVVVLVREEVKRLFDGGTQGSASMASAQS